ncbi:hypothetical protein C8R47DRAFT_749161 [Mycena vitilis]|nr:hypothetical protein C8R47DRAFT_749161 [Mycena vitilis]
MQQPPPESSQVGKLFTDTLASIRANTPDVEVLELQANEWLKEARSKLLKEVEDAYYKVQHAQNSPESLPAWALDPSEDLFLQTDRLPAMLKPYHQQMCNALVRFLKDCGFERCEAHCTPYGPAAIVVQIWFPTQVAESGLLEGHPVPVLRLKENAAPVLRLVKQAPSILSGVASRDASRFELSLFEATFLLVGYSLAFLLGRSM